ncbi:MAG: ParB N-terminal domain-containing protein [Actinobacteria bacterium]|nr:ParB N-terminal domain-containing protein [Actinomycetota bacterium]
MEIEIRELERKYEGLRIADPGRVSRLTASIHQYGQQTPVFAVPSTAGGYVLIDGYARVSALESLAHDGVEALILPLSEAEALIQSLRFEAARRRCALEDGWLLRELVEVQGQHQAELAVALQRSPSWISRRLALVRVLPEPVQAAVRRGQIPPQAAMRSLVPLSRGKAGHCRELVEHLEGRRISVRQMDALYEGYRQGDEQQRRRLIEHPWLYLKAKEETQRAEIIEPQGQAGRLIGDLETLSALARRVRQQLHAGVYQRSTPRQRRSVDALLTEIGQVLAALVRLTEEKESHDAGSGPARGHPAPARTGARRALHRPSPEHLEELGQACPA